jgi:Ca2+-binding EF-hand superfamily protein
MPSETAKPPSAGGGSNISPSKSRAGSVAKNPSKSVDNHRSSSGKEKRKNEDSSEDSSIHRKNKPASVSDGSGSSTSGSGKKSAHPGQHRKQSSAKGGGNSKDANNKGNDAASKEKKGKSRRKPIGWFSKFIKSMFEAGEVPVLKDPKAMEAMMALNLSAKHLRLLKSKFDEIDIDGSGSIDAQELFDALGEPKSPFTEAVFAIIDIDGSGYIEFDEFVRMAATYCMYTKDEILRFCFEMFDKDGSGAIDERELMILMKYVRNNIFPSNSYQ